MKDRPLPEGGADETVEAVIEEGGDAACWAHLVCEECGRVIEPGGPHRCENDENDQTSSST